MGRQQFRCILLDLRDWQTLDFGRIAFLSSTSFGLFDVSSNNNSSSKSLLTHIKRIYRISALLYIIQAAHLKFCMKMSHYLGPVMWPTYVLVYYYATIYSTKLDIFIKFYPTWHIVLELSKLSGNIIPQT